MEILTGLAMLSKCQESFDDWWDHFIAWDEIHWKGKSLIVDAVVWGSVILYIICRVEGTPFFIRELSFVCSNDFYWCGQITCRSDWYELGFLGIKMRICIIICNLRLLPYDGHVLDCYFYLSLILFRFIGEISLIL